MLLQKHGKVHVSPPGFVEAKPKFFVLTSVLKSPMMNAAQLSHPDKREHTKKSGLFYKTTLPI